MKELKEFGLKAKNKVKSKFEASVNTEKPPTPDTQVDEPLSYPYAVGSPPIPEKTKSHVSRQDQIVNAGQSAWPFLNKIQTPYPPKLPTEEQLYWLIEVEQKLKSSLGNPLYKYRCGQTDASTQTDNVDLREHPSPSSDIAAMIAALSKRSGTIATLLLDTSSGSLIHTAGHLPSTTTRTATLSSTAVPTGSAPESWNPTTSAPDVSSSPESQPKPSEDEMSALAAMAMALVRSAGALASSLDDETKLLRLRTKKYELVIVPDVKFTFVVVHETPGA